MAKPTLARDFKEFLRLLNSNGVEYLLIGGYAVGIYGFIRATNIWTSGSTSLPKTWLESIARFKSSVLTRRR
jgi:hypothetical protein